MGIVAIVGVSNKKFKYNLESGLDVYGELA
jgi:hypothetical protein